MVLGSYMAVIEVQIGDESDSSTFDKVAFLYIYLEPTISGTIVLLVFSYQRRYLLKSYKLLQKLTKTLEDEGVTITTWLVKYQTWLFCSVFVMGNTLWNLHSYMNGKTTLHSLYENLGWCLSFHVQQIILLYFLVHMDLSYCTTTKLNEHLQSLKKNSKSIFTKLTNVGNMHFELCKSIAYINKICTPTILLFSVRSYFVLCCSLMSLNGMLPKLKIDFFILAFMYVGTATQFVIWSEMVYRTVSNKQEWISVRSECLHTIKKTTQ